nr:PREDICTED: psychosine receptor-like [Linepithema humile]
MYFNESNNTNDSLKKSSEMLTDYDNHFILHILFLILEFCHTYYIPFIVVFGLFGNLVVCVFSVSRQVKDHGSSYFLTVLSIVDFSYLITLGLVWLNNMFDNRMFNSDSWCKAVVYVSSICSSLNTWLITCCTVERYIAIQYPLRLTRLCSVQRIKLIIGGQIVISLVGHSYSFFTAGLVKIGNDFMCILNPDYHAPMEDVNIVDTTLSLVAPLVCIVTMNIMIILNINKLKRQFSSNSTGHCHTVAPAKKSKLNLRKYLVSYLQIFLIAF